MELIQIGENALKVTLTRADMEYYDIAFDDLDYANAETRRVLGQILSEAKRAFGFEAARERLYIRAFSDGVGGCELFVRYTPEEIERGALYRFSTVALLLHACARLRSCRFAGESTAYIGEDERYYLAIRGEEPKFLSELGLRLPFFEGYLAEHTKLLCTNAVETLASLGE